MTLPTHNKPFSKRASLLAGLGLLALGLAGSRPVSAQVVMTGPALYHGDPVASAGITLNSWGSGSVTEDNKGASMPERCRCASLRMVSTRARASS